MTDSDKPTFARTMAALAVALREKEPDVVQMRVYFEALKALEIEYIAAAADRLMVSATWFPKVPEWRAAAVSVQAERLEAQRALLRKLPAPLCLACSDTSWRSDDTGRSHPCDCRETRRLELLGRAPWPALPAATVTSEFDGTDARAALARLERLGFKVGAKSMPSSSSEA